MYYRSSVWSDTTKRNISKINFKLCRTLRRALELEPGNVIMWHPKVVFRYLFTSIYKSITIMKFRSNLDFFYRSGTVEPTVSYIWKPLQRLRLLTISLGAILAYNNNNNGLLRETLFTHTNPLNETDFYEKM